MPEFRTKKSKSGKKQVFPVSKGKTFKKDYSTERPSFATRSAIHGDVKKIMSKEDSLEKGGKDFDAYQRRLKHDSDELYLKEQRRTEKKEIHKVKHAAKKERKEQKKSEKQEERDIKHEEKLMEKQAESDFSQDQADESNTRETIKSIEGE